MGLTTLGIIHTAISLVAVATGFTALVRDKQITYANALGKIYVWTTVLTCLTGFGIFQHGGFGKPHALGIITLVTLGVAWVATNTGFYRSWSRYIATVALSTTFFFHLIPGVTETTTRLPAGAPIFPNADAPGLQVIAGVLFVLLVIGATLQVRRMQAGPARATAMPVPAEDEDTRPA